MMLWRILDGANQIDVEAETPGDAVRSYAEDRVDPSEWASRRVWRILDGANQIDVEAETPGDAVRSYAEDRVDPSEWASRRVLVDLSGVGVLFVRVALSAFVAEPLPEVPPDLG